MRTPLATLLLLTACPAASDGDPDEVDCIAMCFYLCNSAPSDAGLDVASCTAGCTREAVGPTDCGECWATSGSLQAWDDAALLLDCACMDAPGLEGCEEVVPDPASCDETCALVSGFLE